MMGFAAAYPNEAVIWALSAIGYIAIGLVVVVLVAVSATGLGKWWRGR